MSEQLLAEMPITLTQAMAEVMGETGNKIRHNAKAYIACDYLELLHMGYRVRLNDTFVLSAAGERVLEASKYGEAPIGTTFVTRTYQIGDGES